MAKKDEETLLFDLRDIVQDNMAAKIAQINAEKNDGLDLELIDNDCYFNDCTQAIFGAVNPFIWYGVEGMNTQPLGAGTALEMRIFFEVVFCQDETTNHDELIRKTFRYVRALREIMHENYRKRSLHYASVNNIVTSVPSDLRLNQSSTWYRVGGIAITASIA